MKHIFFQAIACVFVISYFAFSSTYYASPDGKSSNTGTSYSASYDFVTALSKVSAGDSILLKGGTYTIAYNASKKNTITISTSGSSGKSIYVVADSNSRAVIDFSYTNNSKVLDSNITSIGLYVTGSYWYFRGIYITRAGYQGAYVTGSHITFINCAFYENWNSGLEINKGGSYVTVIHCDSYRNFDGAYKNGQMADGFASKQTQGAGNTFIGCRAWENSDDGYDTYASPEAVTFDSCWAIRNGVNVWNFSGFDGNGNGFKVGGNDSIENNKLTRCISIGNPGKGFDQNNNKGGLTIYNCVAYGNGTSNFAFGGDLASGQKHSLKNNISLNGSNTIANASDSDNTWNSGFSVSASDFRSVDTSFAILPRNADGSLNDSNLFRLKESSSLIDAGVDVGLPFNGNAPDLGAFETNGKVDIKKCMNKSYNKSLLPAGSQSLAKLVLNAHGSETGVFSLFDLTGRKVYMSGTIRLKSYNSILDVFGKLDAGLYVCTLTCGSEKLFERIVIK